MPNNIVKSFAKKTGKTVQEVEKMWDEAKAIAYKSGHKEDYDYVVGILKNMLKINETEEFKKSPTHSSFSQYLNTL